MHNSFLCKRISSAFTYAKMLTGLAL